MLTCASHETRTILNTLISVTPKGQGWIALCPCHDDHDPSLSISQDNRGRPLVFCHAGCSQSALVRHFQAAGVWPSPNSASISKTALIRQILTESIPIWRQEARTGGLYLQKRGLDVNRLARRIFFHPHLEYHEADTAITSYPALVLPVLSRHNQTRGIVRIYLCDSGDKAPVPSPKKALGSVLGNSIHLDPVSAGDGTLALCEGPETGLAIRQATEFPVWSALSASGLAAIDLPDCVQRIHIFADWDLNGTGQEQGRRLADRLAAEGRDVSLHVPPEPNDPFALSHDFLDMLVKCGEQQIARLVKSASPHPFRPLTWPQPRPILDAVSASRDRADKLLTWICKAGHRRFTMRAAQRALSEAIPKVDMLQPALDLLVTSGYIRELEPHGRANRTGRPPGARYLVHPQIVEDHSAGNNLSGTHQGEDS